MEIIPILAFIVLVATVSTFVFAFGAYVMFKIRESRGKGAAAHTKQAFQAEYVTPEALKPAASIDKKNEKSVEGEKEHSEGAEEKVPETETRYLRYTSKGYLPVKGPNQNRKN
ncbi:MAG: hypothetical protein ACOY90_21100 [Candidatus Zhuqueibacterota bacterium]